MKSKLAGLLLLAGLVIGTLGSATPVNATGGAWIFRAFEPSGWTGTNEDFGASISNLDNITGPVQCLFSWGDCISSYQAFFPNDGKNRCIKLYIDANYVNLSLTLKSSASVHLISGTAPAPWNNQWSSVKFTQVDQLNRCTG